MSLSNLRILSILIVVIVLCSSIQSRRTRKSALRPIDRNEIRTDEQDRRTRGFSDMELLTAQGFGKRSKNMQIMNRILMEWIGMGNNPKNSRTSREWLGNEDTDYVY